MKADAVTRCWRCGVMITADNGDLVSHEAHRGLLLPVHEMCHATRVRDQVFEDSVENIRICKVPYQNHPFVHGCLAGSDVWLKNDGSWTDSEEGDDKDIPLYEGLKISHTEKQNEPNNGS